MVFIFDENYSPKLAHGLNLLEQGNTKHKPIAEIWHILDLAKSLEMTPENGQSFMDEEVVQIAGMVGGIILTQDKDFRRIKHLFPLFAEHHVGVIFFKTPKGPISYWDIITSFIKEWNKLKSKIQSDSPPFCYCVSTQQGIQKLNF
jgi:predicted nuclease of predicted toxin-antitoxin system